MDFHRSSSLDTFLTCPQKYDFLWRQGLGAEKEALSLSFGSAWHKLQFLWKLGKPIEAAWQEATVNYIDPQDDHRTKDRLRKAAGHYQVRWGGPLKPVSSESAEQEFLIQIPGLLRPVKGTFDGVVWYDANEGKGMEKWVADHKTTSRLESQWVSQYRVSNQFKEYFYVAKQEHPDLAGVLVDLFHVTKGVTTPKGMAGKSPAEIDGCHFYRLPIRYTDFVIDRWLQSTIQLEKLLLRCEEDGVWPMNAPTACKAYGGSCPFLDVCDSQTEAGFIAITNGMKKEAPSGEVPEGPEAE